MRPVGRDLDAGRRQHDLVDAAALESSGGSVGGVLNSLGGVMPDVADVGDARRLPRDREERVVLQPVRVLVVLLERRLARPADEERAVADGVDVLAGIHAHVEDRQLQPLRRPQRRPSAVVGQGPAPSCALRDRREVDVARLLQPLAPAGPPGSPLWFTQAGSSGGSPDVVDGGVPEDGFEGSAESASMSGGTRCKSSGWTPDSVEPEEEVVALSGADDRAAAGDENGEGQGGGGEDETLHARR